jgi:hypothetical protein
MTLGFETGISLWRREERCPQGSESARISGKKYRDSFSATSVEIMSAPHEELSN